MVDISPDWREHLKNIGKSRSPRKLAALAENRKKRVPKMTKSAIYQRARRERLRKECLLPH